MGAVSHATRQAVLLAYQKKGNYRSVARELNVDFRTVKKWVSRYEETGTLVARVGTGRPTKLSDAAASKAVELLLSNKFDNRHQVAVELHRLGLTPTIVSATTLSRRAKAQAAADKDPIVPKTGKPGKALTVDTVGERLSFCQANKKRNWAPVMITERKKFTSSTQGRV